MSISIAEELWCTVHGNDLIDGSGFYCLGGREKISKNDDLNDIITLVDKHDDKAYSGFEMTSRPVMIPEFYDILLCSIYATEFMNKFKKFSSEKSDI